MPSATINQTSANMSSLEALWTLIQSQKKSVQRALAQRLNNAINTEKKARSSQFINIPNSETIEAINESRSGKYAGTLNMQSLEAFMDSIDAAQ